MDPCGVEEGSRVAKNDLKVQSAFHWKPNRAKAHIAIAYMAFACFATWPATLELPKKLFEARGEAVSAF